MGGTNRGDHPGESLSTWLARVVASFIAAAASLVAVLAATTSFLFPQAADAVVTPASTAGPARLYAVALVGQELVSVGTSGTTFSGPAIYARRASTLQDWGGGDLPANLTLWGVAAGDDRFVAVGRVGDAGTRERKPVAVLQPSIGQFLLQELPVEHDQGIGRAVIRVGDSFVAAGWSWNDDSQSDPTGCIAGSETAIDLWTSTDGTQWSLRSVYDRPGVQCAQAVVADGRYAWVVGYSIGLSTEDPEGLAIRYDLSSQASRLKPEQTIQLPAGTALRAGVVHDGELVLGGAANDRAAIWVVDRSHPDNVKPVRLNGVQPRIRVTGLASDGKSLWAVAGENEPKKGGAMVWHGDVEEMTADLDAVDRARSLQAVVSTKGRMYLAGADEGSHPLVIAVANPTGPRTALRAMVVVGALAVAGGSVGYLFLRKLQEREHHRNLTGEEAVAAGASHKD